MIEELTTRELQMECARALHSMSSSNNNLSKFNKMANHDSQNWYRAVINEYVNTYGGLPSKVGPGQNIKLKLNV